MTKRVAARTVAWLALASAGALALGGCAAAPFAAAGAGTAEFTSETGTKKTLPDHAASNIVGEDCSLISLAETGTYCKPKIVVEQQPLFCTKTLADVECHSVPDPYRNRDTVLGSDPPKVVVGRDKGLIDEGK